MAILISFVLSCTSLLKMTILFRHWRLISVFQFFIISLTEAAYLSRPELSDYNFAGAVICEKSALKIKFDHEQFNPGNVFTVEIALNGNFTAGNIISMLGSLSQSGNQQNVFLTVNFPSSMPAGNNYRLRVRGSNPTTFSSQLNEYPFSVSKLPASDPAFSPVDYWRGYFYTWTPSITTPIPDGNTEDIFNPASYIGYICESSNSFEFNWGNITAAPASFPDSNNVCGNYKDLFAIRMRRQFQLDGGYYLFSGGADDGFRFSIDGGQTWLLNDWSDHQFREVNFPGSNGCGIFLNPGIYNFVVEFYENKIDARFKFSMDKAPSAADFTGLQTSYCINSAPSTLFPLSTVQSGTFSGPGISGNVFSPQLAGSGEHTIAYYLSGPSGTCGDTIRKIVQVNPLPDADFTGLPPQICADAGSILLTPNTSGGVFSGSGIQGSSFIPAGLQTGSAYIIRYSVNVNGCTDERSKTVVVQPVPDAGFQQIPDSVLSNAGPINLFPNLAGGIFSGPGIQGSAFFPDQVASPGSFEITYNIVANGCSTLSRQQIYVSPFVPVPEIPIFVPNLITGNKDGLNEDWKITGIPSDASFSIFNRWGNKVHSGFLKDPWNPESSLVAGYYYYLIQLEDKSKSWTGWLHVSSIEN